MWLNINRCLLCDNACDEQVCCRCQTLFLANRQACLQCAEPLAVDTALYCGYCLHHGRAMSRTICPFLYDFPLDQLIQQLKFSRQCAYAKLLVRLSWPLCKSQLIDFKYDFVIPVPLHRVRQLGRGYNQSDLLATQLGRLLNCPVWRALRRCRSTPAQAGLSLKQRRVNLKGGFEVILNQAVQLRHQRLLLVDDVVTTAATVNEAAAVLSQNYSVPVDVWAVARTP